MEPETFDQIALKWQTKMIDLREKAKVLRLESERVDNAISGNEAELRAEAFAYETVVDVLREVFADFGLADPRVVEQAEAIEANRKTVAEHIQAVAAGKENPIPGVYPEGTAPGHVREPSFRPGPHRENAPARGLVGPDGRPLPTAAEVAAAKSAEAAALARAAFTQRQAAPVPPPPAEIHHPNLPEEPDRVARLESAVSEQGAQLGAIVKMLEAFLSPRGQG